MASKSAKRLLVNKAIKTYVQAAYDITEPFGFFFNWPFHRVFIKKVKLIRLIP